MDGLAFFKSPNQPKDRKAPFLQLMAFNKFFGEPKEAYDVVQKQFGWNDEVDLRHIIPKLSLSKY